MDYLHKLQRDMRRHVFIVVLSSNLLLISILLLALMVWEVSLVATVILLAGVSVACAVLLSPLTVSYFLQPLRYVWQAIMHVSPGVSQTTAPNLTNVRLGKELAKTLSLHVYHLAGARGDGSRTSAATPVSAQPDGSLLETICQNVPLPIVALSADGTLCMMNGAAEKLLKAEGWKKEKPPAFTSLASLSFSGENTFESWLTECRSSRATATATWDFVKVDVAGDSAPSLYADVISYYTKDHPSGIESILCIVDRTEKYRDDLRAISFIALAAHELRSPLTLLRSYIDIFDEEVRPSLTPEMAVYLEKMQASAQQFTTFINNILNVARVDEGELKLELKEKPLSPTLTQAVTDIGRLAAIHKVPIKVIETPSLPLVAIDHSLIYEVVVNLLDNAIKYSKNEPKLIELKTFMTAEGMVAVSISDNGVGIAANVLPHLFEKFYRSHHTRSRAGGTGLGLYLCRVVVEAHGGTIQVTSKEGQGTTISFTLQPFSRLASQDGIVRIARGWIKNHSLYKRT